MTDVLGLNRNAWNQQSNNAASPWVQPVGPDVIARARQGDWPVILTPTLTVPDDWFGDIAGKQLLALASGGGQQAPIFAAAGAKVVSFDNSDEQLAKDRFVAEREGLDIGYEQGDMVDLSRFADATFDLIFHPVSNVFSAQVVPVWQECFRILRPGGRLLAGFMNPCFYLFDHQAVEAGESAQVRYALPYRDPDHLDDAQLQARVAAGEGIEFSHSLDDQIGGQLHAGFLLAGFYEDRWSDTATSLNAYMPTSMATLAIKPVD
jgi:SAM-dependent methyltransferase